LPAAQHRDSEPDYSPVRHPQVQMASNQSQAGPGPVPNKALQVDEPSGNSGTINMLKDPRLARLQAMRMRTTSMEQIRGKLPGELAMGSYDAGAEGDTPLVLQADDDDIET